MFEISNAACKSCFQFIQLVSRPTTAFARCKSNKKMCKNMSTWQKWYSEICLQRPLPWETTCLEEPHKVTVRRSVTSAQLNRCRRPSTCLERSYFYGQWQQSFEDGFYCIWCNTVQGEMWATTCKCLAVLTEIRQVSKNFKKSHLYHTLLARTCCRI